MSILLPSLHILLFVMMIWNLKMCSFIDYCVSLRCLVIKAIAKMVKVVRHPPPPTL
ncbi:hypothetical protein SLEP1_g25991 [Rubroshorea leprosula]|uniref:Uncharacterized protein n=1 Tax=Rubroshorea leprosula TaxID=152421 RepID=A0AAV5JKD4_9ROSI|nr:hypothetical protein SLEP1_g25991 [Rubroshorea leprosula]